MRIISRNFKPALYLLNLRLNLRPRKIEKLRGVKLVLLISFHVTVFNKILHFSLAIWEQGLYLTGFVRGNHWVLFFWANQYEEVAQDGEEEEEREKENVFVCIVLYYCDENAKFSCSLKRRGGERKKERKQWQIKLSFIYKFSAIGFWLRRNLNLWVLYANIDLPVIYHFFDISTLTQWIWVFLFLLKFFILKGNIYIFSIP